MFVPPPKKNSYYRKPTVVLGAIRQENTASILIEKFIWKQKYGSKYYTCTQVAYWKYYQHICHIFTVDTNKEKHIRNMNIVPVYSPYTLHLNEDSVTNWILSLHNFHNHQSSCGSYVLCASCRMATENLAKCSAPSVYRNILSSIASLIFDIMAPTS